MERKTAKTPRITLKRLRDVAKYAIPLKYVPEAMKTEALCLAAVEQKEKSRIFRRIFDKHMDDPNDFEA